MRISSLVDDWRVWDPSSVSRVRCLGARGSESLDIANTTLSLILL